ncbi:MAG: helix-turn-helix transcriptional regulator [Bacteroidota bacterium]
MTTNPSDPSSIIIKNMVCPRCIEAVQRIFRTLNLPLIEVQLGKVWLPRILEAVERHALDQQLQAHGFERLDDKQTQLINEIKSILIQAIHYAQEDQALQISKVLSQQLHHDYAYLSRLFSAVEGRTIERFVMSQKIEKVKELLSYDELNLSEIAFQLHYSSPAHLSTQFKKITGMTPSAFKRLRAQGRQSLDEV